MTAYRYPMLYDSRLRLAGTQTQDVESQQIASVRGVITGSNLMRCSPLPGLPSMSFDYEFLLRVHAPRPTVFEKLLRIEHLARWFCGWCRIEPKVGGKFQFGGETCLVLPEGRGWETTLDEGETLRRFAFTWPIQGHATRVAYELQDDGREATL